MVAPPYPIALSGSIFLMDNTENKLPTRDVSIKTIPKIMSVPILNWTGTASGKTKLVSNVSIKPIKVPIKANIKVCANTIFIKNPFVNP